MFDSDKRSAYEAQYEAQKLAFAPVAFQASRIGRDSGVLQALKDAGKAAWSTEAPQVLEDSEPGDFNSAAPDIGSWEYPF